MVLVVPSPHVMVVEAKSESGAAVLPSVNVALVVKDVFVCCGTDDDGGPWGQRRVGDDDGPGDPI